MAIGYKLEVTIHVQTATSDGAEMTLAAMLTRAHTVLTNDDVIATQTTLDDDGSGNPVWKVTAEFEK